MQPNKISTNAPNIETEMQVEENNISSSGPLAESLHASFKSEMKDTQE